MFEISLVPDVKSELIKKLKLRNLIFLICVIVAAACVGVLLILFSVTAGQGIALSAQDTEMACRSEGRLKGNAKCESKYGTAIMKFNNAEELLTIQDQMKNVSLLNNNKIKFSRKIKYLLIPSVQTLLIARFTSMHLLRRQITLAIAHSKDLRKMFLAPITITVTICVPIKMGMR